MCVIQSQSNTTEKKDTGLVWLITQSWPATMGEQVSHRLERTSLGSQLIQLCSLFASILCHNNPSQPAVLWDHHKAKLCDDLHHRLIHLNHPDPTEDQIFDYGLYLIDGILRKM